MENNYTKPVEKLINDLSSDSMVGLSSHEVESRQLKYGLNQLKNKRLVQLLGTYSHKMASI